MANESSQQYFGINLRPLVRSAWSTGSAGNATNAEGVTGYETGLASSSWTYQWCPSCMSTQK